MEPNVVYAPAPYRRGCCGRRSGHRRGPLLIVGIKYAIDAYKERKERKSLQNQMSDMKTIQDHSQPRLPEYDAREGTVSREGKRYDSSAVVVMPPPYEEKVGLEAGYEAMKLEGK